MKLPNRIPLALGAEMFIVSAFYLSLSPLIPDIAADLGATVSDMGRAAGAYAACFGLATLLQTFVADRFSARFWIVPAAALHAAAIAGVASTTSLVSATAAFALAGAAAGVLQPTIYRFAMETAPPDQKASWLACLTAGWSIAVTCGAPLLALGATIVDWRLAYLGLPFLWIPVLAKLWPALTKAQRSHAPAEKLIINRKRIAIYAATLLVGGAFHGVFTFLGSAYRGEGATAVQSPVLFAAFGCGAFLASFSLNHKGVRADPSRSYLVCATTGAALVFVLPVALAWGPFLFAIVAVWGFVQTLAFALLALILSDVAAKSSMGSAMALSGAAMMLGAASGVFLAAQLFSQWGFAAVTILGAAALLASIAPIAAELKQRVVGSDSAKSP